MNNLNMTDITPYFIKESSLFSSYWPEKRKNASFYSPQLILIRWNSEFSARNDDRSPFHCRCF